MGKSEEHLDLRYHYKWKEVPGWQECPRCHKFKEGLLRYKDLLYCRDCLKELDLYDRCRFGQDPNKLERKTNVQFKRCFRKAREKGKN